MTGGLGMHQTAILFTALCAWAGAAHAGTVVAHETEKYYYEEGRMQKFEGQFENTYFIDVPKNTLVRTRVYDYQAKRITPDETVYKIEKGLQSDPTNAARFAAPRAVIRAVGNPDPDSVEILVIDDDNVHSVRSTPSQIIISRAKRLK